MLKLVLILIFALLEHKQFMVVVVAQTAGKYSNIDCPTGRWGNIANQSELELGCPGKCKGGTYGIRYAKKKTNKCNKVLTSMDDCNSAATILKLVDTTSKSDGRQLSTFPTGCYLYEGKLFYNNNSRNNGNTGNCSSSKICICDNAGRTSEMEACIECPQGRFGYKIGQTSITGACPSQCPKGKHGKIIASNRTSESTACECNVENATTCPHLCPAGRFGNAKRGIKANGCPTCPTGRYHQNIEKKETGKCRHPISIISECNAAAKALNLGDVTAENDNLYNEIFAPSGCYYSTVTQTLMINLHKNNKGNCGATYQCICNDPAAIIEKLCPNTCDVGTFGNIEGQKSKNKACPNRCPLGTYGVVVNGGGEVYPSSASIACKNCPLGKFGSQPGECMSCPIGYMGVNGGGCEKCLENTYSSSKGSSKCEVCTDGKKVKMKEMPSTGCLNQSNSLTCKNIIMNIDCEDDPILAYLGYGGLGIILLGTCCCVFAAATRKPEYVDADENNVAQWKSKKINRLNNPHGLSQREQELEATAVAIEMSSGNIDTVDKRDNIVNQNTTARLNKISLIKLKLQWKKLKECVTRATTSDELVIAFQNIREFLTSGQNGDFKVKKKEILDLSSNKKAVSNLRKEMGGKYQCLCFSSEVRTLTSAMFS
jgi:hypothetical protein